MLGVLTGILAVILLLGEPLAEFRELEKFRIPGRAVKLDGVTVHLFIAGQKGSLPTVVIDGDLGLPSAAWNQLIQDLSQRTLVVAWDRPGYGWSSLGSKPHDGATLMGQLRTALALRDNLGPLAQTENIPPPYLLVGQGLGGVHMRIFASQYPDDVAGMVLLDCVHPGAAADRMKALEGPFSQESWKRRLLLRRLSPQDAPSWLASLPSPLREGAQAMLAKTDMAQAQADEVAALDQSLKQAAQLGTFGEKPLRILRTQTPNDPDLPRLLKLDGELASLSTRGDIQVIQPGAPTESTSPSGQASPLLQAIRLALGVTD
ncbi:MAG TPA: alpha/beta hydrolase [Holophagaceae bacterium]|nr:alpha/beta hydrolase [Holophagaceae bacterium]